MPEFAEIEALRLPLAKRLVGHTMVNSAVIEPKSIHGDIRDFNQRILGKTITGIDRYGKVGLIRLDQGTLAFHLRMSGQFYIQPVAVARPAFTRVVIDLENGEQIRFVDQRKFGYMIAYGNGETINALEGLGVDVLDPSIDAAFFITHYSNYNRKIKPLLMDQHIIAGLGNIWADEILFQAKIHPCSIASKLNHDDYDQINTAFHSVVHHALQAGGMNHYNPLPDSEYDGHFDLITFSYGREGQPCVCCGSSIERTRINGRSAFYCPHCQKLVQ